MCPRTLTGKLSAQLPTGSPGGSPHVTRDVSARQEVAGAGTARAGPVRRRPRRLDRQRRAAVDRPRPRFRPGGPLLGGQRLHPVLRRLPAPRRAHGRPHRSSPDVRRRPRGLRAGLARRWSRDHPGHADRRTRRPGPGRRAALPGRALPRHRDVQGGRGAQQGDGRLGRRGRLRRRRGRAPRRRAHRVRGLGVGPVRQRADRPRRRVLRHAPAPREQDHRHEHVRRRRRRLRDGRPLPAGLHAGRRQRRGLDLGSDARPRRRLARPPGRVRGHRAPLEGAARPVQHLQAADDHRHQHRRPAGRDGAVLDVLLRLPLHAAGARLRRARGRSRLPAAGRRDHRLGRHRVGPGDQDRLQAGARRRPRPHRGRARSGSRRSRSTATTCRTSCSRRCWRPSAWASPSCR